MLKGSLQNGTQSSLDGLSNQNQNRVKELVMNIEAKHIPVSPLPKPRGVSPTTSPVVARKSPVLERLRIQGGSVENVVITPPTSPMRTRSEAMKLDKPKPPVRKRKKRFSREKSPQSPQNFEEGSDNKNLGSNWNSVDCGESSELLGGVVGGENGERGGGMQEISEENGRTEVSEECSAEREEEKVEKKQNETLLNTEERKDRGSKKKGEDDKELTEEVNRKRLSSFVVIEGFEEGGATPNNIVAASSRAEGEPHSGDAKNGASGTNGEKIQPVSSSGEVCASSTPQETSNGEAVVDTNEIGLAPENSTGVVSTSPEITPSFSDSSTDLSLQTEIAEEAVSISPQPQQNADSTTETPRTGLLTTTPSSSLSYGRSSKKKPPPLPPPYQTRPPPLPLKQRSVKLNLKVSGHSVPPSTGAIPTATVTSPKGSSEQVFVAESQSADLPSSQSGQSSSQSGQPSSPRKMSGDSNALSPAPICEEDRTSIASSGSVASSVEKRVLTSRPEHLKHLSNSSSESLELSGGSSAISPNRHSMMIVGEDRRGMKIRGRRPTSKTNRPLSDSLNLLEGCDGIAAGHLQDVVKNVIFNDEKMQEATIYEVVQACIKAMPHITSTKELPPQIENLPNDKRSKVIQELYSTEYTYVKGLEVLSEVFKDPLASVLGEDSGCIFANMDDILTFNKGFLALLHSRLLAWKSDSCLGDVFIGMFSQSHRSMYALYCSNYDSAEMLLQQKRKKKEFELQLSNCHQNSRVMPGLTLAAYLITPVQRVPRYILLLKDILKLTPEDHPDYKNLLTAVDLMGELADYIDGQVRESQTKRTFDSLKNKVVGLTDLECPERALVKEGQCFLKNIKKLYQCILFSDMLVFAHGDSRQSKVELQLPLEAVWIEDLKDLDPQTSNQDAIEIYTPDRPYTIYTQTSAAKKLWLAKIRETNYQLLLKEGKCTATGNMDTAARKATFLYADGRLYTGTYNNGRRQEKGTLTWPDQSKYIGDWEDDERQGEGVFTFNTTETYEGKWFEDRINGYGKMTYASGDKYIGYWKEGTRHGKGKIVYSNGDVFEGQFINGHIEGQGELRCRNGLHYSGNWKHSQRHGPGRLKTVLDHVYEGAFSKNHIQGNGKMEYRNGDVYEGAWKGGMRHGMGTLKSKREGVYTGVWSNDTRHGKGKQKYPNGDFYDGNWEHDLRHGVGTLTLSTGEIYTGDFFYDLINGKGEMRYADDCRYNGEWMNGLRHGQGVMIFNESSPMKAKYTGDWRYGLRSGHGKLTQFDGSDYDGMWAFDKPHGKGNYKVPSVNYYYAGDWADGRKEGKGVETSQVGSYDGQWKNDQRHGSGEERTLVGTTFTGTWERNRKHTKGVRRHFNGIVEEQVWHNGTLKNDPQRRTAVELPQLSRLDYL